MKGKGNSYDFGLRLYDPRIGRWLSRDPLEKLYPNLSTYHFCLNNPLKNVDIDGGWSIDNHFLFTNTVFKALGYDDVFSDLGAHYSSVYADHPGALVTLLQSHNYKNDIDYSGTKDSQNTALVEQSCWHAMTADNEKEITPAQAKKRGQEFGWGKILEAAAEAEAAGGLDKLKKNTDGMEALGQGLHALQDAVAHEGVKMEDHSVLNDMFPSTEEIQEVAGVTMSAIISLEIVSGDYSHLSDGMELDLTGTSDEQYNKIKSAVETGIVNKDGVNTVTLTRR